MAMLSTSTAGEAMKRDIDYSLRYPLIFNSKKLRAAMEKLARDSDRSLNWTINRACEEFVRQPSEPEQEK